MHLARGTGEIRTPDDVVLRSYQWDPAGRPQATIILVHGLGEHAGRYEAVAEYFVGRGYAVRACDHRGHGRTGGGLPAFGTLLADLFVQVETWAGPAEPPVYVLGQSLGGSLALHLAVCGCPWIRGVVALSPLLVPVTPPPVWKWWAAVMLSRLTPGVSLRSGLSPDDLTHDLQVVRAYRQDPLVHDRVSAVLGRTMLEAGKWVLAEAARLSLPVLLMHGAADRITSAAASREFAQRAGRRCTLRIWDDLYHELHFETDSAAVLTAIHTWLTTLATGGGAAGDSPTD